jgi:hypothetical protein
MVYLRLFEHAIFRTAATMLASFPTSATPITSQDRGPSKGDIESRD